MANNSSLYGSGGSNAGVSSSNFTTLYSGGGGQVPGGDNVIITGTLTVNGCSILTDCSAFNLLPFNAETLNIGLESTALSLGATTGFTVIRNQLSTANYAFPVSDGTANQVLITDGAGNLSFANVQSLDTNYNIQADTATGGANLTLVGSDATTDSVKFASGTNITVSRTDNSTITISSIDTNTTYTQNSSVTTGGANLNLVGSDSTTDTIKFAEGAGISVVSTDANTITITNTSANTLYNIDASTTTGGANFNLTGSDSSLDTIKFANGTGMTIVRTDANTITFTNSAPDTNTTYTQNASTTTGGANLNLVGSDGTTDAVKFASAGATTVSRTDANTITISSVDTNTTYTQNASATTGGANLNLVGSDATTDAVKFANGTGISVVRTDDSTITITNTAPEDAYTIDATATTGGANLNLTNSAATDSVKFGGSGATTVTRTSADVITISSTDTNTTYTQNASATAGGANLNLVGSDATTDTVTFQSGTNITVAQVDANTISISTTGITPTDVQQVFAEVRNQQGSTITIGQVVYLFGATGNHPTVKLANNIGDATSAKSLGLVYDSSINNGAQGLIITQGLITGVNTLAFAPGDSLYLGNTPGSITNVKPNAPEHLVYIGVVVKSNASTGEIFVRVQNGYELGEIHDVDLLTSPPTNNQVLTYVAATDLWTAQNTQNIFNQSLNTTDSPTFAGITAGNITVGVATDNTIASTNTNGDIILQPNGNGDVNISADTLFIGDGGASAFITTNGSGNLYLNTNNGTNTGSIFIEQGVNGNIVLEPFATGTGAVKTYNNFVVDEGVLFVNATTNRVGINNTSPSYELHIDQGLDGITQLAMTTTERTMILTMNDGDDLLSLNYGGANRLQFDTTNQWFNQGNLGVGTATPAYTLDVNGDIKVGGDTIYNSFNEKLIDYTQFATIYGTSRQANFQATNNIGVKASFIAIDNATEFNTNSLTTSTTAADQVIAYWDPTQVEAIKTLIKVVSGGQVQCIEVLMVQNGTDISLNTYGDVRTGANLTTVSSGYNAITGYWELRVTPVNAVTAYTSNHQIMY